MRAAAPGTPKERSENFAVPSSSTACPVRSVSTVSGSAESFSPRAPALSSFTPSWVEGLEKIPAPILKLPRSFTFSRKRRCPGGISALARKVTLPDMGARSTFTNSCRMFSMRALLDVRSISAVLPLPFGDFAMLPCATMWVFKKWASTRFKNALPLVPST